MKWGFQDSILYIRFLKNNKERLEKTKFKRKYNKFSRMSFFIGTKTSNQCRSHHQKMIQKYKTIDNIIHNMILVPET